MDAKGKIKEQQSKELYEFLSDDAFVLEVNENGTLTEYLRDEDGNKDRKSAVYDSYHEALMSWYDDERRILVDTKKILLAEADYELLGLLNEYKEVKATLLHEQTKDFLTGSEMEDIINNSTSEYTMFYSKDENNELTYYQYFINSDGEFEENVYKKNDDGEFYLHDGGVYETLEGTENILSLKKVADYEIVDVYEPDFTGLQDYLVEYNKMDDSGKVVENGFKFVNLFYYESIEENLETDRDLGLILVLDSAMHLERNKINIHDVSEVLKEIVEEVRSSDYCMAFYDLDDCEEILEIKDDEALDALRNEITSLGVDAIEVGDVAHGEEGYDVIIAYAGVLEQFDFADKQMDVPSLDETVKDAELMQKTNFNKENVMVSKDGKEER